MKTKNIGAQLFTIRDFLKTPENIVKSMRKVKNIGYNLVQVSGVGSIDPKELKKILDDEGLKCIITHEPGIEILNNPEKIIEKLDILNCQYTAYPHPHKAFETKEDWIELAENLNKAGEKFKKAGKLLSYHNHAFELQRFGKKTALDIIFEKTDPENLAGELDTYWLQYGGSNPADWVKKLKNRMPVLHLKDFGVVKEKIDMYEIGYGNLNFKKIIKTALKCGVEYFFVEQDRCQRDPFESLKMSFDYLKELNI